MKTLETIAGNVYCVTSKNGGILTDATGTLNEPIEAGKQVHVTAPSDRLIIDDDEAIMRPANFKGALIAVGGSGGGSSSSSPLPKPFIQAHFLRGERAPYILTDYVPKEGCEIWVDAKRDTATNGAMATFGAGANKPNQIVGTSYGSNDYALYFNTSASVAFSSSMARKVWHYKPNGECFIGETMQEVEPVSGAAADTPLYLFAQANMTANTAYFGGRIYGVRISHEKSLLLVPALNVMGVPCMVDTLTQKVYKNAGEGAFEVGFTLEQAGELGGYLPMLGSELTIYLPTGYDSDEKWLESKALAESKGWVLIIRTYTPEDAAGATTYSMRRTREMVWCRVAEDENGEYVDSSNTRFNIDWCVEVVNPHGKTPVDYGYELFDSVEQAAEAWGLTPVIEFPEDDLTETE